MKKLIGTILNTLLIIAVVGIAGLSLATMLPIPGKMELKVVQSGSMEPNIATGGIVLIRPASSYGVGDVITFGEDTKMAVPTTHRITSVRREGGMAYFTTKGDANEEKDPKETPESMVIGKVLFTAPYVGYLLDFAKQPLGFGLLVALPAALIILHELFGIIGELRGPRGGKRRKAREETYTETRRELAQEKPSTRSMYTRLSAMDDIYRLQTFRSLPIDHTSAVVRKRPVALSSLAIMFALPAIAGIAFIGSTVSSFSDIERSLANALSAAILDFDVDADAPMAIALSVGAGEREGTSFAPFVLDIEGSLPFAYEVTAQMTGGDPIFCDALFITGSAPPFDYPAGPLLALSTGTTTDDSPWNVGLYVPDATGIAEGAVCMVDLIYKGAQEGALPEEEYHDEERLPLMITFTGTTTVETFSAFKSGNAEEEPETPPGDELPPETQATSIEPLPAEPEPPIEPEGTTPDTPVVDEPAAEPPPAEPPADSPPSEPAP